MATRVAREWYRSTPIGEGITLIEEIHVAAWLRCNIWHIRGRDGDLLVDTGMGLRPLTGEIARLAERPQTALMTHSHFDHSGGMHQFDARCGHCLEAAIIADPTASNTVADTGYVRAETFTALPWEGFSHLDYKVRPAPLTRLLDEGDVIDLGDRVFRVFHLPGHSPGSIALFEATTGTLFSGDVIYDGPLIDDLYHSDAEVLAEIPRPPARTAGQGRACGAFRLFRADRMIALLDEYQAGGLRVGNAEDWLAGEISLQDQSVAE